MLVRQCAIPVIGELEARWGFAAAAFEIRLLWFLEWFGLVEAQRLSKDALQVITTLKSYKA